MGGSSWSDNAYVSVGATRKASTGHASFAHHAAIKAGTKPVGCHDRLNPYGITLRESRDSDAHPESNAIVVALDVTGSMGNISRDIQGKLCKLMGTLLRKTVFG